MAEQLLALAAPPSAIFASNDDMAAAVVAAAHRRGLDVPRDLTVAGFDDTALATTIRQPAAEMAPPSGLRGGRVPADAHSALW